LPITLPWFIVISTKWTAGVITKTTKSAISSTATSTKSTWQPQQAMTLHRSSPLKVILTHLQCQSKKSTPGVLWHFFPHSWEFLRPNFTRLLYVLVYARVQIFIQLSATMTNLCHIQHDHPIHIICAKCPPSAKTHTDRKYKYKFLFNNLQLWRSYAILSATADQPACVSPNGGHFEHIMVVELNMA